MFFNKSIQSKNEKKNKQPFSKENTYILRLADNYLDFCFKNLSEDKVRNLLKGQFSKLKYTLSGYDSTDLSYKDKIKLIGLLFDLHKKEEGSIKARKELESLGLSLKERLGVINEFKEGIKDLPEGVFSIHKVDGLDVEELKALLKEKVFEIRKLKELADKKDTDNNKNILSQKDMFETILYTVSDGVFALDKRGRIITFNKAMEKLTGYEFKEVRLKSTDQVIRLFEDLDPLDIELYCNLIDEGNINGKGENKKNITGNYSSDKLTLVARNGEKKYVKMKSSTIEESGVDVGCVVTLKDVTKDVELETMKLDFVSMAAHELRTPLTAIRGYLSFLDDELKSKVDSPYDDYIQRAVLSAHRLYVLIENLLNISRIERGELVLEKSKHKWIPLVQKAVEQFEQNAEAVGIKLVFSETPSKVPDVMVDEIMISEVLANLIDNAVKYTKGGGRITIFVEEDDDKVITHIKDTGIGIPRASIPHIFKKFYRVSTVLKEGEKGTGLGLFISKEIVKLHKGNIWVESTEGEGSTFSFSLPIVKKED